MMSQHFHFACIISYIIKSSSLSTALFPEYCENLVLMCIHVSHGGTVQINPHCGISHLIGLLLSYNSLN
jgi:hypothetical protein